MEERTIVIGGGLAGLTAAATLAKAGSAVTLVEGGSTLGGRARSRRRDGFDVNLGPHALYRVGGGLDVLRRLGVRVRGRRPRVDRAGVFVDGGAQPALRFLRRATDDRLQVLRALAGLGPRAAAEWAGRPVQEWIDEVTGDPVGRLIVSSVVRTATYSADLTMLDAGAATTQLRSAAHGVLYLHGGWSSLVDGLAEVIRTHGGEILVGTAAESIEHDDQVHGVRLVDGRVLTGRAAIIALHDPRRAAGLLHGDAAARLGDFADGVVPVRLAHLDVTLRPLPTARFPNLLGIDEPVFVSVPSAVADVAPHGAAVVHVARYLRPGEEHSDHRPLLEVVLDAHQPGWRDHVIDARYMPRSLVCGDHARVATGGAAGRAAPDAAGVAGVAIAGDWVGPDGTLADAAILSGERAAMLAAATKLDPMAARSVPR